MQILIIRPGAIGDTLLAFPVMQALQTHYKNAQITFVGNAAVLPLALATDVAAEVYNYDDMRWARLFMPSSAALLSDTIIQRTELAIGWLHDPAGVVADNLQHAGIPRIIVAAARPTPDRHSHIVTYLAQTLALPTPSATTTLQLHPTASPAQDTHAAIRAAFNATQRPIAIHPGSGGTYKCWPAEYFAAVIKALWLRAIPVLLLAGPAESERVAILRHQLPDPPHTDLLQWLIDAPLLTVAHHLQNCRGYLGNDSGLTHLAALLGLPTIALFGPSDPLVWRPVGPFVTVLHEAILQNLAPDTVLASIKSHIG